MRNNVTRKQCKTKTNKSKYKSSQGTHSPDQSKSLNIPDLKKISRLYSTWKPNLREFVRNKAVIWLTTKVGHSIGSMVWNLKHVYFSQVHKKCLLNLCWVTRGGVATTMITQQFSTSSAVKEGVPSSARGVQALVSWGPIPHCPPLPSGAPLLPFTALLAEGVCLSFWPKKEKKINWYAVPTTPLNPPTPNVRCLRRPSIANSWYKSWAHNCSLGPQLYTGQLLSRFVYPEKKKI